MTDLPPLDQPQAYVVVGPDDQRGPYTLELLIGEVVAGRLADATPVWWPGLADWTTMAAHPGVASEVYRRRNPAPADAPGAFAPPVAPPPPSQPPQPAPGQYQQAEYGYGQSGGGYQAGASAGQDFSTGMYAAEQTVQAEPDVSPQPAEEPMAPVSPVDQPVGEAGQPAEGQEATQLSGEVVEAETSPDADRAATEAIEVPPVDITPADFEAVDAGPDGVRSAGQAEGLLPQYQAAYADLVTRSRARADAAAIVESIDGSFSDAIDSVAAVQDLEEIGRSDDDGRHTRSYRAVDRSIVEVSMSPVTGHAMAVRDGHVDLDVSCRSSTYGGGAEGGSGEHGEIVVSTVEYGGESVASVSLLLPLSDYVSEQMDVDEAALRRDLEAVVASVRHRLS